MQNTDEIKTEKEASDIKNNEADKKNMKKKYEEKKSAKLGTKLCIIVIGMIVILGIIVTILSERIFVKRYESLCNNKLNELVKLCADSMDIETLKEYYESGEENETIIEYKMLLENIRKATTDIDYLYVYKPMEDRLVYLFDTSIDGDDTSLYSDFGDEYIYVEWDYENLIPSIQKGEPSKEIKRGPDTGFGRVIEAWYPILDENGETAFMVEADMKITEVDSYVNSYMRVVIIAFVTAIVLIALVYIEVNKYILSRPLRELTEYVESYEDGGFQAKRFERRREDELSILAKSFDNLNDKINLYIDKLTNVTKERERINTELDLAARIQASYLPNEFPAFPEHQEFDLYATMNPAKEVGGDFYDFFFVDDKHLAMVMADVSGKGIGAALFMMISKTLLNDWTTFIESPGKILAQVNNRLCERNDADMFVTVWLGVIDIETGLMKAANAGHEYPAIKRANGEFELYKDVHGLVLGGMEDMTYKEYELTLEKNDIFYIYTDGVAEATNVNEELFGTDRMLEALNKVKDKDVKEILLFVKDEIDCFVGDEPSFDDITMLGFKYFGKKD